MLGFITLCTTIAAWGQDQITRPKDCIPDANGKNPGGNTIGGSFIATPAFACLSNGETKVSIINLTPPSGSFDPGILYEFNYREADGDLEFKTATADISTHTYKQEGIYWIAVNGKQGSTSFIMCKSVEVIKTEQPDVQVDACDPLNVSVEIQDTPINQKQDRVIIDWGDGNINTYDVTSRPMTIPHSYTSAPTSKPKIQGQYVRGGVNRCSSTPSDFPEVNNTPPKISELEGLSGGTENKITMKDGNPGEDYIIEMSTNNGTWAATSQTIKAPTASNTSSATITGLNATNEYCFRLSKAGTCATSIQSNVVCTIKPTHNVLSATDVKVDWVNAQGNINYYDVFYKEFPSGFNQNSGRTSSPSVKTFTFSDMDCSTKYEFQIIGTTIGSLADRVIIKSPTFIVTPLQGGRVPFENLLVVSTDKNIAKVNTLLSFPKINIYKAEGNSTNFQLVQTVTNNEWEDANVELKKQQYCYKVEYEDDCGNISDQSPAACTLFLTSAQSNTINWTPFTVVGTPPVLQNVQATEYTIQILDENGIVVATPGTTFDNEADVRTELDKYLDDAAMNGRVTFRILALQNAEVSIAASPPVTFPFFSYSNEYTFITPALVYYPSAFTPNGDTHNEVFLATGKYIADFNMIIYNRWGAPIFESKDIDIGWDGKENGTPAPTGYYSFKIFGIDNAGQEFSKTGSVLLMR